MNSNLLKSFVFFINLITDQQPVIVSREQWGAKNSLSFSVLENPVPFVIIHHSYQPDVCTNLTDCMAAMKWIQNLHQINNSWNDIGYNFVVGGDGRVYEGRGWNRVGAHSPGFNFKSIGICLIGNWTTDPPPNLQLSTTKKLIKLGVNRGYIQSNYTLHGHRNVFETDCPGNRLFSEIKTWGHFAESTEIWAQGPQNNWIKIKKNKLNK